MKKSFTLNELIELYDKYKSREIKTSTKLSNKYMANALSQWKDFDLTLLNEKLIENDILNPVFEKKSVSYTNKIRSYLNKIFSFALKEELIIVNPISKISIYRNPDEVIKEVRHYTPDDWRIINQCFKTWIEKNPNDYIYFVIISILYYMGMRIGEVLALSKNDIINNTYINIYKTCTFFPRTEIESGYLVTAPKTFNSRRKIKMPKILRQIMNQYFEYYNDRYTENAQFLFGGNQPVHIRNVGRKFKKITELGKLPQLKVHSLRHSHASFLINNGAISKAVAERLGNTETEVQKTYSHLFKSASDACVQLIDDEFF
ncbi:tyrosine-type recombinase/integrase [Breznakia pachnodae]|uniref:Integrase n=1 Tax=Breznakia pachnodae TaxID=265178 RepID=A0ABU0E582_9FIRM|nr:site-specific integrase [Breznakia pachnodae]MDQ0361864.1 integrase [Breznakia pachnodae]